jgi:hypothetical protein
MIGHSQRLVAHLPRQTSAGHTKALDLYLHTLGDAPDQAGDKNLDLVTDGGQKQLAHGVAVDGKITWDAPSKKNP